ncbi:MAG: hypothetical protein QW194_01605 [Candidatus Micrarchaeaceae archaeon]|jgi:hypothetical protein
MGFLADRRARKEREERWQEEYIKTRVAEEKDWLEEAQKRIKRIEMQDAMDPVGSARRAAYESDLVEKFKKEESARLIREEEECKKREKEREAARAQQREDERIKRRQDELDYIWRLMP